MKLTHLQSIIPLCLLGACAAVGERGAAPSGGDTPKRAETGEATRQWLDRERQGQQAAAQPQPLSGPVQEQIYERYQKSFSHPIPERFESERVNSGSGAR